MGKLKREEFMREINGEMHYYCRNCKDFKVPGEMRTDRSAKYHVRSICKRCFSEKYNKGRERLDNLKARGKKYGAYDSFTKEDLRKIKSHGECAYCGVKLDPRDTEVDHVVPCAYGGPNSIENVVASCKSCNGAKSRLNPYEFHLRKPQIFTEDRYSSFLEDFARKNTGCIETVHEFWREEAARNENAKTPTGSK